MFTSGAVLNGYIHLLLLLIAAAVALNRVIQGRRVIESISHKRLSPLLSP